jgi:hypothetical protein
MTSKNPFEVRLDVLKMAQDMLETEQKSKEMKFKEQIDTLRSIKHNESEVLSFIEKNAPTSYTAEDIIARSSSLYNFVSSSTKK